ncbi:site-2 protease family protein [Nocardioides sp. MJB4]|uniref:Zinc metalloprotease n=1 Tax=Nocardioides donggukensis TaxID=2774019 RepID=A0A927PZ42_9ACTN|nr:site-2 protease family protein [Nocardioides donggukensis]
MAGVDVLITPSWFLIAALLAIVLAPIVERSQPGLGPWRYLAGFAFAVLLYLSVLLHEASHAVMAQRFGHPVSSITLHFLGGMTAIEGESRRPREEFWIAVVGPLTSIAVGVVSWLAWQVLPGGLIGLAVGGLAAANLLVGVLNLVPGLPLDGGRVLKAGVWSLSGNMHRGTIAAGWGGRLTAVAVLAWPLLGERLFGTRPQLVDYLLVFVIALFLWTGATAAMQGARMRRELPSLVARDLARRTLAVPGDLPVAEAVRRAQEAGAGGIVTVSGSGTPVGIVNEGALLATPEDRRPWMAVSSIARTIEDGLSLPVDIVGEDLIRAITRVPAHEYLLVEKGGEVYGVLTTADVDRAFSQRHR